MPQMIRRPVPLTALAVLVMLAAIPAAAAQPAPPPHTIPGSQIRVLPPTEAGRHYQLHVGLPASYGKEPGRRYPASLGGILRFNQRIASRKHEGLVYEFRIIDGERHAGMQLEAYTRGLRFAFAPLAPESGPATRP